DHQILTALQTTAQWLQLVGQRLDQRRLARTVGTEQADPCARHQLQLDLVQYQPVAIAETPFGQIQQRTGNLVRFTEHEVERRIDMRRGQFFQSLKRLDSTLCLARLARLRLET